MTEKELHMAVHALRNAADKLIDAALQMPPTIELCVFTGKLSAAFDILEILVEAGAPVCDSDEEPHTLERKS